MNKCKYCAHSLPTGNRWMCMNEKNKQGDFVMFVKGDDDYDHYRHCFKPCSEYDLALKKKYI